MKNLLCILLLVVGVNAQANDVPGSFTYQGKVFNADGTSPLEDSSVLFKVQILSPDGLCLLFEETHLRNMTGTQGAFSLIIGEGSNTNASALNLFQVFDNSSAKAGAAACAYTPIAGDTRRLRFSYDTGTEVVSMSVDQSVRSVPYAMNAQRLQGLGRDQIIQVSSNMTQAKSDTLFGYYTQLIDLASGNSTQYAKAGDLPVSGGVLNLSSGGVQVSDTPSSNNYAVNKNYTDSKLGGLNIDLTGIGNGQSIVWNAALSKWQTANLSLPNTGTAGTYAKVTTDAQGRVVSGSALAASDIPVAAGDVTGSHTSLVVAKIQGVSVSSTAPTAGQTLTYNAVTSKWEPQTSVVSSVGTAGTYTKVTTDAQGRVTAGATLAASDIPTAAGDVTGAHSSLVVAKIQGVNVSSTAPTSGQFLTYNSTTSKWEGQTFVTPLVGTAGTYAKVTTDAQGRVVSGSALSASDVPAAAGDVTGAFTSMTVAKIQNIAVSAITPSSSQIMGYNSTTLKWEAQYVNMSQLRNAIGFAQFPSNCTSGQVLAYQSPTDTYICTNISISSAQVSGLGGAATLNVGTTAGTVAAGNDSRIANAVQSSTTGSGDISGTWLSNVVAKIQGIAVSSTAPTAGQVLKYNGVTMKWEPSIDVTNVGTVTSISAGSGLTGGTITGSGTLAVDTGTAANQIVKLDNSARLPAVDGSQLTNLPIQTQIGNITVLDSTASFTVPAGVTKIYVQVWGGGGGAAGGAVAGYAGGGGGSGSYVANFITVTPGQVILGTVGAGGTAGAVNVNGVNGTASTFGSLTAGGGEKGLASSLIASIGGVATGGLTIAGAAGELMSDIGSLGKGGSGGAAPMGGGAGGIGSANVSVAGSTGTRPGGGGGGGSAALLAASAGGAGAAGRIAIWW